MWSSLAGPNLLFAIYSGKKADLYIAVNANLRPIFFAFQNIALFVCFLKKKNRCSLSIFEFKIYTLH